ncbi:MAG: DUF456 domain-containing protein [Anaerolineales bacterium]|nr:DUF456 domain-containing protein [Anaerolineales bacterium]
MNMPEWVQTSLFALTLVTMLVGLAGLVIPIIPGIVIIWLAALGYGVVHGFGTLGGWMFAIMTVLMIAGSLVDNVLSWAGAKQGGASWYTMGVGIVAGILGTIFIPPIGGLVAAPLAILLLEYIRLRDWKKALTALRGMATGWGLAFVIRFVLGLIMILLWLTWALNT